MATHMASCTACSTNTPTSSRSKAGWLSTSARLPRGRFTCCAGSGGTHQITTAMPASASDPVKANSPPRPTCAASSGASTRDSANIRAMLAPTSAMALVRTSSRVVSASKAVTAAEMAPAPCSERPKISQVRSGAQVATKLPSANTSRPNTMTFLRPSQSEAMPKGICKMPWVRP